MGYSRISTFFPTDLLTRKKNLAHRCVKIYTFAIQFLQQRGSKKKRKK